MVAVAWLPFKKNIHDLEKQSKENGYLFIL